MINCYHFIDFLRKNYILSKSNMADYFNELYRIKTKAITMD